MLEYKGYIGKVDLDDETGTLHRKQVLCARYFDA